MLSKTFSFKLTASQVREVRPFFHAHHKINVTTCCGLAGRYRDQGANDSRIVFRDRAEDFIPPRPQGLPIPIC